MSSIYTSIIIMAELNCCKNFWWFYYADTNDILFAWFHFLVCFSYFTFIYAKNTSGGATACIWTNSFSSSSSDGMGSTTLFFAVSSDFASVFPFQGISFTLGAIMSSGLIYLFLYLILSTTFHFYNL